MNTFDVNVLVNGSRCKQYNHNGNTYVEAKDGSEWYFQIQNNSSGRIMAVCSVDGLSVLTGEKASSDDNGYIIDAYSSQKIKGFRFSDDEWALFKFGYKLNGKTYAQSKGDGSERNCGVIGIKLFYEKPPKIEYIPLPIEPQFPKPSIPYPYEPYKPVKPYDPWKDITWKCCSNSADNSVQSLYSSTADYNLGDTLSARSANYSANKIKKIKSADFDIGTEWSRREKSVVTHVDFERGSEAYSTNIYYASRGNLIEMGVPITNKIKINRLPQSFPNNYCKPPKNWHG